MQPARIIALTSFFLLGSTSLLHARLSIEPTQESTQSLPSAFVQGACNPFVSSEVSIYHLETEDDPLSSEQIEEALTQAASEWSEVPCATISLRFAGTLQELPTEDEEERIVVWFSSNAEEFENSLSLASPTLIGFARCIADANQRTITLNAADYRWAMTPDFVEQLSEPRSTPRLVDLPSIVTHELGHTLGLDHVNKTGGGLAGMTDEDFDRNATMVSYYRSDGGLATLAADDRVGLCTLYPRAGGEETCQSDGECRSELGDPGATCVELEDFRVCEEERAGFGDYCSQQLLICPEICLIDNPSTGTGFCTRSCQRDDQCPDEYVCASFGEPRFCDRPQQRFEGCSQLPGRRVPWEGVPWLLVGLVCVVTGVRRRRSSRR